MVSGNFGSQSLASQVVAGFASAHLSEDACRRYLLPIVRPVMVCPGCQVSYSASQSERVLSGHAVICAECGRKAFPRTGTILEGVHCGFREVLLVAVMLHWQVKIGDIATTTGISTHTVRRLAYRLERVHE